MTPTAYGEYLASLTPPVSRATGEAAARILAGVESEDVAA